MTIQEITEILEPTNGLDICIGGKMIHKKKLVQEIMSDGGIEAFFKKMFEEHPGQEVVIFRFQRNGNSWVTPRDKHPQGFTLYRTNGDEAAAPYLHTPATTPAGAPPQSQPALAGPAQPAASLGDYATLIKNAVLEEKYNTVSSKANKAEALEIRVKSLEEENWKLKRELTAAQEDLAKAKDGNSFINQLKNPETLGALAGVFTMAKQTMGGGKLGGPSTGPKAEIIKQVTEADDEDAEWFLSLLSNMEDENFAQQLGALMDKFNTNTQNDGNQPSLKNVSGQN